MDKRILVTGGSGLVGRSLQKILPEATYISSKDCDLCSEIDVMVMYDQYKPDIVIHLAAKVGGIVDNINKPAEYFTDNIMMNTLMVKWAHKYKIPRFIGVLSTCIYPDNTVHYPMGEEQLHNGPPTSTNFSYGYAKRCLAVQIDAYNKQYNTKYNYITPSNLYGEHDKSGANSHFVTALIKKIHEAKINSEKHITLFGTGKPLRQFLHVSDLSKVIKYCIDHDVIESFNVATSENKSIAEIAEIALKACSAENLIVKYDTTMPDGQYRKDVSIDKLLSIYPEFKPISLFDGIKQTYETFKNE